MLLRRQEKAYISLFLKKKKDTRGDKTDWQLIKINLPVSSNKTVEEKKV